MKTKPYIVIGLGKTGLSCIQYLLKRDVFVIGMDTRLEPPCLAEIQNNYPAVKLCLGKIDFDQIKTAQALVLSPGVSLDELGITHEILGDIPVFGDIEIFAQAAKAPIIGVTGTNAKGTVTTLVGEMIAAAGYKVLVGGNIGIPALDLLAEPTPEYYVMELSSFQLETTYSLKALAVTMLNISDDHLDRHGTLENYIAAKQRIYNGCQTAVYNADDKNTYPQPVCKKQISFTLSIPAVDQFGIVKINNKNYLALGSEPLLAVEELKIKGQHNWANALAALALGSSVDLPIAPMLDVLKQFTGLHHRCEWVRELDNVIWFDDSKGTNVGATLAALQGLGEDTAGKIVLIAGGLGKDADFTPLRPAVNQYVKTAILIGKDAPILEKTFADVTEVIHAKSLAEAVSAARIAAQPHDIVLLSPACASMDMFRDYVDRGEQFKSLVRGL